MNTTQHNNETPSAAADKPAQFNRKQAIEKLIRELRELNPAPAVWTSAQHTSAVRISERFNVPFRASDWIDYGDYVGARFEGCLGPIFIGIERDGYAHS